MANCSLMGAVTTASRFTSTFHFQFQGSVTGWRVTAKEVNVSAASSLVKKKKKISTRSCLKLVSETVRNTSTRSSLPWGEKKRHSAHLWCFDSDREGLKEEPQNFVGQADGLLCLPPCAETVC